MGFALYKIPRSFSHVQSVVRIHAVYVLCYLILHHKCWYVGCRAGGQELKGTRAIWGALEGALGACGTARGQFAAGV